jgi:hypothetical protein
MRGEECRGQGGLENRVAAEPPRAVRARRDRCGGRQHHADPVLTQHPGAPPAGAPLRPGERAQPPYPPLQVAQDRSRLAEPEIAAPAGQIDRQTRDRLLQAAAFVRRVSCRTRLANRTSACGAIRRRGTVSLVKLKPRNLRALGRATALLAALTFSLRRLVRNCSTLAITRSSARRLCT